MKRLIIFLVRKKLGLKKGEHFRFANQASRYNTDVNGGVINYEF